VPGEISQCTALESLSLEGNKLTAPLLDLRALSSLRSLQLSGNPIEFLPELSPCVHLRHLTLANVRLAANATMDDVRLSFLHFHPPPRPCASGSVPSKALLRVASSSQAVNREDRTVSTV
jgi:hypothetical protein